MPVNISVPKSHRAYSSAISKYSVHNKQVSQIEGSVLFPVYGIGSPPRKLSTPNVFVVPNSKMKKFDTISSVDLLDLVAKGELDKKGTVNMKVDSKKTKVLTMKDQVELRGARRCKTLNINQKIATPEFDIND